MVVDMLPTALPSTKVVLVTVRELEVLTDLLSRLKLRLASGPVATAAPGDPVVPGSGLADQVAFLESALRRAVVAHPDARRPGDPGFALAAVGTVVDTHDGAKRCRYRLTLGLDARDDGEEVLAVSVSSPVGAALMGRAVGDAVDVDLPGGRHRSLEILRIVGAP
jgi:transcription elongation GreA/GreB family factor